MENRKSASVMKNEDEDEDEDDPLPSLPATRSSSEETGVKLKLEKISEEEVADDDGMGRRKRKRKRERKRKRKRTRGEDLKEEEEEQEVKEEGSEKAALDGAVPVGKPVRISGKGKRRRSHYDAFEYNGNRYSLKDPVLIVPKELEQKPYVAIIKDEDDPLPSLPAMRSSSEETGVKLKLEKIPEEEVADDDVMGRRKRKRKRKRERKRKKARGEDLKEEEEEQEVKEEGSEKAALDGAVPVGKPVRISGKGKRRRSHYDAFEYNGNRYGLKDPVLIVPKELEQKPYVAIIKDIAQSKEGMMVTGHWFYRPEEAERRGGGRWQSCDNRELFYSFHCDEVPAECVMHRCVVHFVPIRKQLPNRKQYPGFIVQRVYDDVKQKLHKLTSRHFEDSKQQEIDILVQKTLSCVKDLPDIRSGDTDRE